jgi:hypothetical protein
MIRGAHTFTLILAGKLLERLFRIRLPVLRRQGRAAAEAMAITPATSDRRADFLE